MKNFIPIVFVLLMIMSSCGPEIGFDSPQPAKTKSIKSIQDDIIGEYLLYDSILLPEIINGKNARYFKNHPGELPSNHSDLRLVIEKYKITNYSTSIEFKRVDSTNDFDGLSRSRNEERIKKGDTLILTIRDTSNLIDLKQKHVLKFYEDRYFLNLPFQGKFWETAQIRKLNDSIIEYSMLWHSDLDKLRNYKGFKIHAQRNDTLYTINPTRDQFKEFISNDGFGIKIRFIKVK